MTDEQIAEFLREAARDYHQPPEVPRDAIWARIDEARRATPVSRTTAITVPHWTRWGMGIAAALVLGIAIGTQLRPAEESRSDEVERAFAPENPGSEAPGGGVARLVALEHLSRTEGFLTMFRADTRLGRMDRDAVAVARAMLTMTRLLQGTEAAADPKLEELLGDLEVILVQIARLGEGSNREEAEFITEGIEQRDLMLKLRSVTSERVAGVEGVL